MFNKKYKIVLSTCVAGTMLFSSVSAVFANTITTKSSSPVKTVVSTEVTLPSATPAPSATPDPTATTTPTSTPEPDEKISLDVFANYIKGDKANAYGVEFTIKALPEVVGFNVKASFKGIPVLSAKIDDTLKTLGTAKKTQGDNDVAFEYSLTDPKKPLTGILKMFSVDIEAEKTALTTENLKIEKLELIKADGKKIIVTPTLMVQEGELLPDLSANLQAVVDATKALPTKATLSFFNEDKTMTAFTILSKQVSDAKTLYTQLSSADKRTVDKYLNSFGIANTVFDTLLSTIKAMQDVSGVVQIASAIGTPEKDKALTYEFLLKVAASKETSSSGLNGATKALSEYNSATETISRAQELFDAELLDATYPEKAAAVVEQGKAIKTLAKDKYYAEYIDTLLKVTTTLKTNLSSNYNGSDKNRLLDNLEDVLAELNSSSEMAKDLPSVSVDKIMTNRTYSVNLTRKSAYPNFADGEVTVKVYTKNGYLAAKQTEMFKKAEKKCSIMMPYARDGFVAGQHVTVSVDYKINGITYNLEDKDMLVLKSPSQTSSPGNSGGNGGNGGNPGSGTIYPKPTVTPVPSPTPAPDAKLFDDLDGHKWAIEAVEGLYYAGIVNGMEEGKFNPGGNVTREQFAKMVDQLFKVPIGTADSNFKDVDTAMWYAPFITAAVNAGYIQGQSDDFFGVGESIMRQDMATILYRALGDKGKKVSLTFTDSEKIATYARDGVAELVGLKVISGYEDGTFLPRGTATRAEAAKMIWGVYNIIN
ncbi:MAG: S-layer homology domain-containing protein [Oscillospiraceae bacterium]